MDHVERELERIREAIKDDHWRIAELQGAQQALAWVLNPETVKSPFAMITGAVQRPGAPQCPVFKENEPESGVEVDQLMVRLSRLAERERRQELLREPKLLDQHQGG